ncbi:MAG: PDZ domain-containing protein [Pedosphaera sp.]|nr:PDZ domain-containing protein [Pedosphaera sp.]
MKTITMPTLKTQLPVRSRRHHWQLFLLSVLLFPRLAFGAEARSATLDIARQLNQAFIDVAEKVSPSVVVVEVARAPEAMDIDENHPLLEMMPPETRKKWLDGRKRELERRQKQLDDGEPEYDGSGSGIAIRKEGYVLTNTHVVEGAQAIRVRLRDGRKLKATIRGIDPQSDIAVLKIEGAELIPAQLGDSSKTRVGEFAIAIGAPFELDYSVTFGHVSAKGRNHVVRSFMTPLGSSMDQDFIQTDASINPGNSGGPLVNIEGEVIGINTMIRGLNTGIGFAVPINLARTVAEQLISDGRFKRAWLGIGVVPLKDYPDFRSFAEGLEDGVVVERIDPRGPAYKSELRPADVITRIEGVKVNNAQELRNAVRSKSVGSKLTLDVVRNNKPIKVQVKSDEWPEENLAVPARMRAIPEEAQPRFLGLKVETATKELAKKFNIEPQEGVIVIEVEPGTPAARAGIQTGDLISEANHKPVKTARQFSDAIKSVSNKGVLLSLTKAKDGASEFRILKDKVE